LHSSNIKTVVITDFKDTVIFPRIFGHSAALLCGNQQNAMFWERKLLLTTNFVIAMNDFLKLLH
jgi:hypothetical protein